jgi:hypothetical protein
VRNSPLFANMEVARLLMKAAEGGGDHSGLVLGEGRRMRQGLRMQETLGRGVHRKGGSEKFHY